MKILGFRKLTFLLSSIVTMTALLGCSDNKVQRDLISPETTQLPGEIWDGDIDETWFNQTDIEFHIKTAQEFAGLANLVNTGYESFINKKIYVDNDIRLNDISNYDSWDSEVPDNKWTPIGINEYSFRGVIDFDNHVVQGMYINWQIINANKYNQNIGLFGSVKMKSPDSPVYICNLQLYKSFIYIPHEDTIVRNVGSVVGSISNGGVYGKINGLTNVVSDCRISCSESATKYVGGISGFTQANIINCGYTGSLELKNCPAKVGGVAAGGAFPSFVINSYSTANITASYIKTTSSGVISFQCMPINCYYLKTPSYNKNHFAFGYVRRIETNNIYKPYGNGVFESADSTVTVPYPTTYYNGSSGLYGDNVIKSGPEEYDNLLTALNSFSFKDHFTFNGSSDSCLKKWTIIEGVNHGYPIHTSEAE